GDVSAYIPTNVISITDGQIYLEKDLFNAGVRPPINVGISVSRVGGNAQIKAMKQVAGRLRLDLAQFRELEAFATFGSELDRASQAQLDRGARVVEILKQPQYEPVPVAQQVMTIFAVTNGFLDDVAVEDVSRFASEFLVFMEARHPEVGATIAESGALSDELTEALRAAIKDFRSVFVPSEGQPPLKEAAAQPLTEVEQEALKRFRRPTPEEFEARAGHAGESSVQLPG
ncbi:MAG TPA: F0F1 ATP synthase subunit alpha, partial [Actinomycetota bacterium]|nr:F0F1 ATP synthase subunit alpha [Actinomycetota bacterium]